MTISDRPSFLSQVRACTCWRKVEKNAQNLMNAIHPQGRAPRESEDRIKELVRRVPNLDSLDRGGRTALHHACYMGDASTAKHLFEKGASLELRDIERRSPLDIARERNFTNLANEMAGWVNFTHLVDAINSNATVDRISQLIGNLTNIDLQDGQGFTALHHACSKGNMIAIRLLFRRRADTNLRNNANLTPYGLAQENGCRAGYKRETGSVLIRAITTGAPPEHIDHFIDHVPDINFQDENGDTFLHHACRENNANLVQALCDRGGPDLILLKNGPLVNGERTGVIAIDLHGVNENIRKILAFALPGARIRQ